jgi:hypothetical protein
MPSATPEYAFRARSELASLEEHWAIPGTGSHSGHRHSSFHCKALILLLSAAAETVCSRGFACDQ